MLSPICLFTYNRLSETIQTVEALQKNELAVESDIFIFSDGPKNEKDAPFVNDVRQYLKTINGFRNITILESESNKGLAKSIIDGVSYVFTKYEKIIVLEDDLITSPNFLAFCNQALDFYENSDSIFSISGYTMDLPSLKNYNCDYYIGVRASSWGWATWKNRWEKIDWSIKDYCHFKYNLKSNYRFMKGGSDMSYMLWKQMNGKIDSWAIRWCYNQFKMKQYTIFPKISKIQSVGFGFSASNTKNISIFRTHLDITNKMIFNFNNEIIIHNSLLSEFKKKFSLSKRIKNRLKLIFKIYE